MKPTANQIAPAVTAMQEYLDAPKAPSSRKTPAEISAERDKKRGELIDGQLKPLVEAYITEKVEFVEFKSQLSDFNIWHPHWGFKGFKGQMLFNMVANVAPDIAECDQETKAAILIPTDEDKASKQIRTFANYVRRIGDEYVKNHGKKQCRPNVGSIPYFLSYFWHIQDRNTWPIYHTNTVNMMVGLKLWQPSPDLSESYIKFKHMNEILAAAFTEASHKDFDLCGVERVFWFKGGNPYGGEKPMRKEA